MEYTITAANDYGSTTTVISITINSNPPSAPVYSGSPYVFTEGTAISPLTPSITGAVTSCSGALPPGLSVDSACVISGTPTTVSAATSYSITATNAFGAGPAGTINIAVNPETTPPSTPTAFNATPVSQTQIDLSWLASTDNITAQGSLIYEICRSGTAGGCSTFTATHTTGAGAVTFSSTGLTAGTTYYFVIRSKDAANNVSAVSAEISATTNVAGTVSNPLAAPAPGLYNSAQSVTWSVASPAASTICYTTDGSPPACDPTKTSCTGGSLYSAAIGIGTADTTVKAIGCKATYADSGISTAVYTFDTTAPAVTGVTASAADGTYTVSAVISVQVTFSEIVNVVGTPTLSLATGSPAATAVNYTSGSGTTTLTFDYTVASGNTSPDLDYASTAALVLGGGTIRDGALNNATLTLPAPGAAGSLGSNKNILINPPPTIISSAPPASAQVPSQMKVVVTFDKPMNQTSVQSAFSLTPGPVAGSFAWTGNAMTFTPTAALPSSGLYTYTVTTAALSGEGVPLASAYSRNFNAYRGKLYSIQATSAPKRFDDGEGLAGQINLGNSGTFNLSVDVDTTRDIMYVSYGETSGGNLNLVRVWHSASTVTPAAVSDTTINASASGMLRPSGLVVDKANDRLYVNNYDTTSGAPSRSIFVFNNASALSGATTPVPARIITHASFNATGNGPRGMAIDFTRDVLYMCDYTGTGQLLSWNNASSINGTVAPDRILTISGAGPSGVSIDEANNRIYVSAFGATTIYVFDNANTRNGLSTADRTIAGAATTLNSANSLHYVPELDRLYIANYGANTVFYWNSASTLSGNIAPSATPVAVTAATDVFFDPLR